ncbi:DUF2637 domain-containing protein [Streptomyces californicus]|uniref:DUF2637 domain-containing protein n=1 Tax=Streptomyces californicus TaxID=67351 RepID=UPI00296FC3A0|nr:DUF2637 domain-containing protein [Streptomyces californicus]MDW4902897.1 DUF2637 domain-containing protein [Streptomyces californicus]
MPVRTRPDAQLGLTVSAAVLTTALTAVSFWLSFEALHDLAVAHRLKGERAWAWPATVDLFIVIGELLILRASLLRRVDPWAIVLTAAGSIGSIVLNIASVSGEKTVFLDYVVAAVPPVAALLAFGVLMRQVHEYLASRQQVLTAPPVPSAPPVTPPVEPEVPVADQEPQKADEAPVVTEEPEPVKEPERTPDPLTQPQQIDAVVRALYDSMGNRRPATRHMTDALEKAGLPSSDATARTARKRVEAAEPHLKTLPSALAA